MCAKLAPRIQRPSEIQPGAEAFLIDKGTNKCMCQVTPRVYLAPTTDPMPNIFIDKGKIQSMCQALPRGYLGPPTDPMPNMLIDKANNKALFTLPLCLCQAVARLIWLLNLFGCPRLCKIPRPNMFVS